MLYRRRIVPVLALGAVLWSACAALGFAQSFPGITIPSSSSAPSLGPGIHRDGAYLTAPIYLDGVVLFHIAEPVKPNAEQLPIDVRQESIEGSLSQIISLKGSDVNSGTVYDPKTLKVVAQPSGDQTVIVAYDAHHSDRLPIVTVTADDAKYARVPLDTLASQWQQTLQTALVDALDKRQPAELAHNRDLVLRVGILLVLVTLLIALVVGLMQRSINAVRREAEEAADAVQDASSDNASEDTSTQSRRRFMGLAIRSSAGGMRIVVLRAVATILAWGMVLAWFAAVIWGLSLFPETTLLSHFIFRRVASVATVIIGAIVFVRIANVVVLRSAETYGKRARHTNPERRARLLLRIPTIASAVSAFVTFAIVFVAVLGALGAVGISTGSVLTLGGIVALGVTFAAQNVLRDVLNGFFVLLEDQYVVGDFVVIDQYSGVVENLTLRVVQIRDAAGNLITIPHGQTTQVVNSSKDWSRVDYRVPVEVKADVAKVAAIIRDQIAKLAAEDAWKSAIVEAPEAIGVDSMSSVGIIMRASVKTAPLRQFELRREINARVLTALRENGIALGVDPRVGATAGMTVNPGPVM
jgi:small conductance mechanosensitive channel